RELGPAFDLMRAGDTTGLPVHRSAEADTDGRGFPRGEERGQRCFDLRADARGSLGRLDGEPQAFEDSRRSIARDDLQFGAAYFDAKTMSVHAVWSQNERRRRQSPISIFKSTINNHQ